MRRNPPLSAKCPAQASASAPTVSATLAGTMSYDSAGSSSKTDIPCSDSTPPFRTALISRATTRRPFVSCGAVCPTRWLVPPAASSATSSSLSDWLWRQHLRLLIRHQTEHRTQAFVIGAALVRDSFMRLQSPELLPTDGHELRFAVSSAGSRPHGRVLCAGSFAAIWPCTSKP